MNINDISEDKNLEMSFFCCTFAENLERREKYYESTMDGVGG